jgi:transaldolase
VGAALISPFVGRIMDWYKAKEGRSFEPHEDPGVASVQRIYKYYKAHNISTIVMAASFRNAGEIKELAGCDKITISPALLAELEASTDPLPRKLWPDMGAWPHPHATSQDTERLEGITREQFEKMHNADEMAVAKLKEGIEGFEKDQAKLEEQLMKLLGQGSA